MYCECKRKTKLRSHNTSYCLIEVVAKASLPVDWLDRLKYIEKFEPKICKFEFHQNKAYILNLPLNMIKLYYIPFFIINKWLIIGQLMSHLVTGN
jgi:hypothetical protein